MSTKLEQALGHTFQNQDLLTKALTHASAEKKHDNERLEFLGDHVLGLCIAEKIFHDHQKDDEGLLSKRLAALVRKETCAHVAQKIGLADAVIAGPGEDTQSTSLLGDTMEAVLAAVYLDGGLPAATQVIQNLWDKENLPELRLKDAKSELQEHLQAQGIPLPTYKVIKEEGTQHDKIYTVEVRGNRKTATGTGPSKRKAEQAAADGLLTLL